MIKVAMFLSIAAVGISLNLSGQSILAINKDSEIYQKFGVSKRSTFLIDGQDTVLVDITEYNQKGKILRQQQIRTGKIIEYCYSRERLDSILFKGEQLESKEVFIFQDTQFPNFNESIPVFYWYINSDSINNLLEIKNDGGNSWIMKIGDNPPFIQCYSTLTGLRDTIFNFYDHNHNLMEQRYISNGRVIYLNRVIYDANNSLKGSYNYEAGDNGSGNERWTFFNFFDGLLRKRVEYWNEDSIKIQIYKYQFY